MLAMAISLSVAIAFSPNYIVYTVLRSASRNNLPIAIIGRYICGNIKNFHEVF